MKVELSQMGYKQNPTGLLRLFHHVMIQREICHPEEGPHLTRRLSDGKLPASGTLRNAFLLYTNYPVCGVWFWQPTRLRQALTSKDDFSKHPQKFSPTEGVLEVYPK